MISFKEWWDSEGCCDGEECRKSSESAWDYLASKIKEKDERIKELEEDFNAFIFQRKQRKTAQAEEDRKDADIRERYQRAFASLKKNIRKRR